jgi:hypothetical protein
MKGKNEFVSFMLINYPRRLNGLVLHIKQKQNSFRELPPFPQNSPPFIIKHISFLKRKTEIKRHSFSVWKMRYCNTNVKLRPWSTVLVEKLTVTQLVRKFLAYCQSLLCSQEPTTILYLKPDESIPHNHTLFP